TNNVSNAFYDFEDFSDIVERGTINIVQKKLSDSFGSKENFEKLMAEWLDIASQNKSEIVVIDSISSMRTLLRNDRVYTRAAAEMAYTFRSAGLTSIFTMEVKKYVDRSNNETGLFNTSMFDGIISLSLDEIEGSSQYNLYVPKLRNSNHRISSFPYQITSKGFDLLTS
ncbi:MAG: RAD55 family ATPase, partial [Candidatus Micrarchaeia archaeon]